jgi:hypothetical protein
MAFTQGHALVIGIGTYKYTPKRNVPVTRRDAEQVAQVLCDPQRCGYPKPQVTELTGEQATRQAILDALEELAKLQPTATVFLFYAGHGDYDKAGAYYLTTHDTEMAEGKVINQSGVRQDELLTKIKAIPAKRMLLVFNACHSGAVLPGVLGDEEETGQSVPQDVAGALLSAGEGRIIMTACREEQKSYYERGENTPMTIFTQKLLTGLNGEDIQARKGTIGVFDLYTHVYDTVRDTVSSKYKLPQEPELTVSKGVGVMAVALYPGQTQLGELGAEDRPGNLGRVVHELDAERSRQLYEKVVNLRVGQIGDSFSGPAATASTVQGNQVVAGHNAAGRNYFDAGGNLTNVGNTTNIDGDQITLTNPIGTVIKPQESTQYFSDIVHGDKISVGTISDSVGVAIGHNASSTVSGDAPRTYFDAPAGGTPPKTTVQVALHEVRRAEEQARQVSLSDIAYELQRVAGDLDSALQAETSGNATRRKQMVDRALRDLAALAAQDSRVQPLLSMVQQVS